MDPMAVKSLQEFLASTHEKDVSADAFELESPHMLEIRVNGMVWAKAGSMVARKGAVKFTRQGLLEQGLGTLLKKMVSGEGLQLMKIEGQGRAYLADAGKQVTLLRLAGESIFVNGNDVLAFETGIESRITMMRKVAGMLSGGLFNIRLSGHGIVAITSHYEPLTLPVTAGKQVTLLRLAGESIFVNGNDVLAFETGIESRITMMRKVAGMLSGGLFNMRLSGHGIVAITSHYEPLTLPVTAQGGPVFTDPNATVAWSGSLTPEIVTDISLGTLVGRGSGETLQLRFAGEGWVVVQPYEEVSFQAKG